MKYDPMYNEFFRYPIVKKNYNKFQGKTMKNKQFSKDISISGFKVFETKELRDRAFNFYKKQINRQNKINRAKGKKLLKANSDNFVLRVKLKDINPMVLKELKHKNYDINSIKELKKSIFDAKPLTLEEFTKKFFNKINMDKSHLENIKSIDMMINKGFIECIADLKG